MDALRNSPKFGSLVKLVPGEADGFCAERVRTHGGTVFTSDSDLLVYDLGDTGGVVFFTDIDADLETHTLIAPQYRPADLCRRLSLRPATGLQYLAFELSRDYHLTLEQAVEKAKTRGNASEAEDEYPGFIKEYLSPEVASTPCILEPPALDPRVSEIVLRSLHVLRTTASPSNGDSVFYIHNVSELEMYTPLLLDCPTRTSAWEASKPYRQLAYAVLQSVRGGRIPSVSEIKKLQFPSSGSPVAVPSPAEVDELGDSLLEVVARIQGKISKPELLWTILAIHQDIVMSTDRGKDYPISLQALNQDAKGKVDTCSWEFLHFLAQTQATCYSLRILQQILDFTERHAGPLSTTLSQFTEFLSCLPPLTDFPSARTFGGLLQAVRESGSLSCLQDLFATDENISRLLDSIQKPQDSKKSKKRKASASGEEKSKVTKPRSNNPFGLLVVE